MEIDFFLKEFDSYNDLESNLIYSIFNKNNIDTKLCIAFYKLILASREIGYKYNAHIIYAPFESFETEKDWDYFIIKNKKEFLLKVYYTSNYDLQQIEDNLTALYY